MDAVATAAPYRHPWLDRLIAAPTEEVRALAEGKAKIHPYRRAEPSDAAATLLYGLASDDPALKAFDQGALKALEQYRAATARNDREQLNRIALAALDLMTIVQRLSPHDTVVNLHRRFTYWNAWAETLVLDRGLDLRREYWRALALTQDVAAKAGLVPRRLLPFWLDLCGEAGPRGRYDESYLTVGLLGLRSLPLGTDEAANEEAALHGLARWADAQRPAKRRFLREWHVLEGAFPREPTFWTDLVARVVASVEEELTRQTKSARTTFDAAEWWREDVEAVRGAHVEARPAELEPPPRELREALLADISANRPFNVLEPRLNALMQRHERYATRTGDLFYLVRTACNIGMRLLSGGGDVPERRAAKARDLARLALRFEGANVFAWALWRDAFAAEGHLESAELIGWEAIRRFPENPQWRTQLALLLADRLDRPDEAQVLLRETMRLFPGFPENILIRTQLAQLIGRQAEHLEEAIALLDDVLAIEPTDEVAKRWKRNFENGKTSTSARTIMPTKVPSTAPDLPVDVTSAARMRRALFRVRTAKPSAREAARKEAQAILSDDENLAYARYVAAAAGITQLSSEDSVPAVVYLAATRDGTGDALPRINMQLQGVDSVVISLAGASRGDEEATAHLKAWIAEPANDLSRREQGLRTVAQRIGAPLPHDFVADMLAASLGAAMAA